MSIRILSICLVAGFAVACLAQEAKPDAPPAMKVTYDDHVKPIFREHCLSCHNQEQKKGGLALDSYSAAMTGGASGEVVLAGDIECSRL
jgi:mono/diheme cytochrome c family protein